MEMPLLWGLAGNIQALILLSHSLCLFPMHTHTHIFMVNMVGARMRRSPLLVSTLWGPLSWLPPLPPPLFPPYWPPITLPRLHPQNKTAGQGRAFLQVQTYHVKRWHIFWRNGAKGRRGGFGRENINKGVLIWWSPVAHKEKWKRANEKLLTIQSLWMTAWRPKAWNINLVFTAWMQKNGFCVCLIISLLESRSKWLHLCFFFCFYLVFLILYNPVKDSLFHGWTSSVNKKKICEQCVSKSKARRSLKNPLIRSFFPIALKRKLLWYHITQLSVLTHDFDR